MVLCTSLFVGESQLRTRTSKVIASDTSRVLVTPSSVNLLQIIIACNVSSWFVLRIYCFFVVTPVLVGGGISDSQQHRVCVHQLIGISLPQIDKFPHHFTQVNLCVQLPPPHQHKGLDYLLENTKHNNNIIGWYALRIEDCALLCWVD